MKWMFVLLYLCLAGSALGEPAPYINAEPGYQFSFPKDHRPHPGYKTEWWYYSGHLTNQQDPKQRFGFQFTIFRLQRPQGVLYLFHCGLSGPDRFRFDEVLARDWPGVGGLKGDTLWVHNNRLKISANRHQLTSHCKGANLTLNLTHRLAPVIHGEKGISPKGDSPKNATHYYSVVDLTGEGELKLHGKTTKVHVDAWMDHEFGSNFMEPHQKGWDWSTLTLDSGDRLMVFRMRQQPGPDFYWGTVIKPDGGYQTLRDITMKPTGTFRSSKSQASYPDGFELVTPLGRLILRPWWLNQELVTKAAGMTYFEGAVDVTGTWNGQPATGSGYLEMTGYTGGTQGKF